MILGGTIAGSMLNVGFIFALEGTKPSVDDMLISNTLKTQL